MKTIKMLLLAIAMICSAALVAYAQGVSAAYDVTCMGKLIDVPITVSWDCCNVITETTVNLGAFDQCQTKDDLTACLRATVTGGRGWSILFEYNLQMTNYTGFRIDEAAIIDNISAHRHDIIYGGTTPNHHEYGDMTQTLNLATGQADFTLYIYKATAMCTATFGAQTLLYVVTASYN